MSLELLINFPIAIKCTCYKIGGYAFKKRRNEMYIIFQSIYINTAARSEQKDPATS